MLEGGSTDDRGDGARVEELLRVNAELAAEIRSLQAGRASEPRSAAMPAARRLGRLTEELKELRAERDDLKSHRQGLEAQNQELARHVHELSGEYDDLAAQVHAQAQELARLRSGLGGIVRRARSRLTHFRRDA